MLTNMGKRYASFLAVFLTAVLFFMPLGSFGVSPEASFLEGENAFSFPAESGGEYLFQPTAPGVYLVKVVSSAALDCYVSIKGASDSFILDNAEGTAFSFLLSLSPEETCYFDFYSLYNRGAAGTVTVTYQGRVSDFSVVRPPEKNLYVVGIDAFLYRGGYLIKEPDLTGCAVQVRLENGTALLFEDREVKQFLPLRNYSFSSLGKQNLSLTCMEFRASVPIEIREAVQKEKIGMFGVSVSHYYAFASGLTAENAASVLNFAGAVTRETADRLITAAFCLAGEAEPLLQYRYADPKTDIYRIPAADMESLLRRYFSVSSVTPIFSTYYNETESAYILPMTRSFPEPDTECILQSLILRLLPDGTRQVSFLYNPDFSENGRLILTLSEEKGGYKVCGITWGIAAEISLAPDGPYRLEEETGFILNILPETRVSDFTANFNSRDTLVLRDAAGNTVTDGYVGTGMTLSRYDGQGRLLDTVTAVVRGDLNGDGIITTVDYLRVRGIFANTYTAAPAIRKAADVNGDGAVSSTDYMQIRGHFAGTYTIR